MNMKNILSYMEENKQLLTQVDILKDSLMSMSKEYKSYLNNPNILKYKIPIFQKFNFF